MSYLPVKNLLVGIIAGTIDILAAIIVLAGGNIIGTFKYIASGAFGKTALEGSGEMGAWGEYFITSSPSAGRRRFFFCIRNCRF